MNHILRRKIACSCIYGLTGRTTSLFLPDPITFIHNFRSSGPVYSSINTTSTNQFDVGCINYNIYFEFRDITPDTLNMFLIHDPNFILRARYKSRMIDRIRQLESLARKLEPSSELRELMLQQVQRYGEHFLKSTIESKIKVFEHDHTSISRLDKLGFSEMPKSLASLLELLYDTVDTTGINPAAPNHFGYVPGGGIYPAALGDYLVDLTNRYAGITFANPGAVRMENILLEWMAEMVGYPKSATGNLASGGSIASLIAIVSARDHHKINPENVRKSVVYCTSQIHHCLLKAFRIAGLDYLITRHIQVDRDYAMDPKHLEKTLQTDIEAGLNPFLILASAGSTDVGVIDPLKAIGLLAKKYSCWFHVDAAYGGFFMLVDNLKEKFDGMELSDSVVIDPHKGLFLPYGTGAVLVKERAAVVRSHHYRANYMQDAFQDEEDISPADVSPELTKHFRGLRMWLPLQLIGLAPFKAALEEKIYLCRYFYQKVKELGFEAGPDPMLSVCLFRWTKSKDPDRFNQMLLVQIQKAGSTFISSTTIDSTFWLRVCIMVFRTHLEHVDQFLTELAEIINQEDFGILETKKLDN